MRKDNKITATYYFDFLERITGKNRLALHRALGRKGYSIFNGDDIQAYLLEVLPLEYVDNKWKDKIKEKDKIIQNLRNQISRLKKFNI